MNNKDLKEICKYAVLRDLRRGEAVLCERGCGKKPEYSLPFLEEGDVCLATTFFSTGHINPDTYVEIKEMYECPHKAPRVQSQKDL